MVEFSDGMQQTEAEREARPGFKALHEKLAAAARCVVSVEVTEKAPTSIPRCYTGVIVDKQGAIATSLSQVRDAGALYVHTPDHRRLSARIEKYDQDEDLAILRLSDSNRSAIDAADFRSKSSLATNEHLHNIDPCHWFDTAGSITPDYYKNTERHGLVRDRDFHAPKGQTSNTEGPGKYREVQKFLFDDEGQFVGLHRGNILRHSTGKHSYYIEETDNLFIPSDSIKRLLDNKSSACYAPAPSYQSAFQQSPGLHTAMYAGLLAVNLPRIEIDLSYRGERVFGLFDKQPVAIATAMMSSFSLPSHLHTWRHAETMTQKVDSSLRLGSDLSCIVGAGLILHPKTKQIGKILYASSFAERLIADLLPTRSATKI